MGDRIYTPRRSSQSQQSASGIPGLNHSRRSWATPNGSHFTVETASYNSPGFTDAFDPFDTSHGPARSRQTPSGGNGFLGNALGMLDNMVFGQGTRGDRIKSPQGTRERAIYVEEAEATDSEELSESDYSSDEESPQPTPRRQRSVLSRFKDKLRETPKPYPKITSHAPSRPSPTRTSSPPRPRPRPRSYHPHTAPPRPHPLSVPSDASSSASSTASSAYTSSSSTEPSLPSLELELARERDLYARAKRRFQRISSSKPTDHPTLKAALADLQAQERALELVEREVRRAKLRQPQPQQTRPTYQQTYERGAGAERPRAARPGSFAAFGEEDAGARFALPPRARPGTAGGGRGRPQSMFGGSFADSFTGGLGGGFESGFGGDFGRRPSADPFASFDPFEQHRASFDRMFAHLHSHTSTLNDEADLPFPNPQGSRPRSRRPSATPFTSHCHPFSAHSRPSSRPPPQRPSATSRSMGPTPHPPKPTYPPAGSPSLLARYNGTWSSLSSSSPHIPYPSTSLHPDALASPATIPCVKAAIWSTEKILQTNAQLFFLQALSISPVFNREEGEEGICGVRGLSEGKREELKQVLKGERGRWHSDRLGRRNGGDGGTNVELQGDERARAVFHGVCHLMDVLGKA